MQKEIIEEKQLKPISRHIIKSLLLLVISVSVILDGWLIYQAYTNVHQSTLNELNVSMIEKKNNVEKWMTTHMNLLDAIADDVTIRSAYDDRDEMEAFLEKMLTDYPEVLSVYMCTADNLMIDSTHWRPDETYIASERDWYKAAIQTDEVVFTEPYVDAQTEQIVLTISRRIMKNGELMGVAAMDIVLDEVTEYIKASQDSKGGYVFLVNSNGEILAHPQDSYNPQGEEMLSLNELNDGEYQKLAEAIHENKEVEPVKIWSKDGGRAYYDYMPTDVGGWFIVGTYPSKYEFWRFLISITATIVGLAVVITAVSYTVIKVSNIYVKPLKKVTKLMDEVAQGNLNANTHGIPKNSTEMKALVESSDKMIKHNRELIEDVERVLASLKDGDFTVRTGREYIGDYATIQSALNKTGENLGKLLSDISVSFDNIWNETSIVSDNSSSLMDAVKAQFDEHEEMTSAFNLVSDSVNKNAENAKKVNNLSEDTQEEIAKCKDKMDELNTAMTRINELSGSIRSIIFAIKDIAHKTNILSLNASVEAARAGASGKGFAVVADEIRDLATGSSDAAKETEELVEATIEAASKCSVLTEEAVLSLNQVITSSERTMGRAGKIADATNVQAEELNGIREIMDRLNSMVSESKEASSQSADASGKLSNQIQSLHDELGKFSF